MKMEDQMQNHGQPGAHNDGGMETMNPRRSGGIGMNNDRGGRNQNDAVRQQEIECYEEELSRLDDSFPYARQALDLEIHRVRGNVPDMIDIINNRKIKVRCRISIPQDEFPGINLVGRLLGQNGTTLKKLQQDCDVKMAILGRGSMRDPQKEQEAFESGDPKYQHLKQPLHLQIDCMDAPEEAYYRVSQAVYEVKNIITPDPSEMANLYGPPAAAGANMMPFAGRGRGRGGMGPNAFGGGGFGGAAYDGGVEPGFRGRGGRGGGRGFHGVPPRGGPHVGGPMMDNAPPFGDDFNRSFGGGKSFTPKGRGAPRRPHPYARGM